MNSQFVPYPLLFSNIYMQRIWGGNLMHTELNRNVPKHNPQVGESWDVVDRPNEQSIVQNGLLKGKSLAELRYNYGDLIFGKNFDSSSPFPLLVKIIDAGEDLSLQVHPAEKDLPNLPNAESKTEMWYVLACKENAKILAGLKKGVSKEEFIKNIDKEQLRELIQVHASAANKHFFINSGTVHAIGGGNLLLEIQQNSDTTYRVSDWGRMDANGKTRELHIEQSLQCINFESSSLDMGIEEYPNSSCNIIKKLITPNNLYFKVWYFYIKNAIDYIVSSDSYNLITNISHKPLNLKLVTADTIYREASEITIYKGQTALLPANTAYVICTAQNSFGTFLVYHAI